MVMSFLAAAAADIAGVEYAPTVQASDYVAN